MKNFIVYRSSAGSGKTFTLVKEYLRLALYDETKLGYNYTKILAITFTNKAAAEMKSRVVNTLESITDPAKEFPKTGELLCHELNLTENELRRRAAIVLQSILHHYSDFAIGTIDSFTHKIVKAFAHDLRLPVNFNIELDTAGFYDKVIALLFNQVGEDEYITRLLKDFVLSKAEDNTGWDPEKQIKEFSALLEKENSEHYIRRLKAIDGAELENLRKQLTDYCRHYRNTMKTVANEALQLIAQNNLIDDNFRYKKTGPQTFFKKCANSTATSTEATGSRLTEAIKNNRWWNANVDTGIEKVGSELSRIATQLIAFICENYSYYSLCNLLSGHMYSLMLLKKLEEISLEQKQEERLVFISEFNQKIFGLIDSEPAPYIYERLGERYQHYLIDEFQDTSSLQWQNLLPLVDNSLANGWFNLVVGDGKQSIYRWRNANVKQFAALPETDSTLQSRSIIERGQTLKRNFGEQTLNTNFRSLEVIVEFNNALFDYLSLTQLSEEAQHIYLHHKQQSRNAKGAGYASIDITPVAKEENINEYTFSQINTHISNALASGFSYGDICILARRNAHGNTIAGFLTEHNIPVISSDSLLLKNNPEVNTLVCFIDYLANTHNTISAAAVLNYLRATAKINSETFHESLRRLAGNETLFSILMSCGINTGGEDITLSSMPDICVTLAHALGLEKKAYHYVRFFLDEVNEFMTLKNSGISAFPEWWQTRSKNASLVVPEGTNAVRIMTIHASKGLEFPIVIVPYCNWPVYQAGNSWVNINNTKVNLPVTVISLTKKAAESGFEMELEAEQNAQALDNINLLYVAFTRAVERLHILANQPSGNHRKCVNNWLEAFVRNEGVPAGRWFFERGAPVKKQEKTHAAANTTYALEPIEFNPASNVVKIKTSWFNNNQETEEARQQGIVIHWLLSKIKTQNDLEYALNLAEVEGLLNRLEIVQIQPKLEQLLTHPQLKDYFAPGVNCRLEAEIMTANAELLRPDRVVVIGNTATVIDYKTGRRNDEKYTPQLVKYSDAMLAMGFTSVKKLLLYINEMVVVELN